MRLRVVNNYIWRKIFGTVAEGQAVINKNDGTKDSVKEVKVSVKLELPLFELESNARYVLAEKGEVSKSYFDMNYDISP